MMSSRERQSLDNFIMGVNIHESGYVTHTCPSCKASWLAWMLYELGGWFYPPKQPDGREAEEGAYCPHCNEEGEIVEEE